MQISLADLSRLVADLRERLQSEVNRSIRKRDLVEGEFALGGMDALDRLLREIQVRAGVVISEGHVLEIPKPKLHTRVARRK